MLLSDGPSDVFKSLPWTVHALFYTIQTLLSTVTIVVTHARFLTSILTTNRDHFIQNNFHSWLGAMCGSYQLCNCCTAFYRYFAVLVPVLLHLHVTSQIFSFSLKRLQYETYPATKTFKWHCLSEHSAFTLCNGKCIICWLSGRPTPLSVSFQRLYEIYNTFHRTCPALSPWRLDYHVISRTGSLLLYIWP